MSAETIAVFSHDCDVPVSDRTRALLERALVSAADLLDEFGLKGSIGLCDLLMEVDGPAPSQKPSQWLRRIDIPEMEILIRPSVGILHAPIRWSASGGDPQRKTAFEEVIERMAVGCNGSDILLAPYPCADINRAYESILNGATFPEAAQQLRQSGLIVEVGRKAAG